MSVRTETETLAQRDGLCLRRPIAVELENRASRAVEFELEVWAKGLVAVDLEEPMVGPNDTRRFALDALSEAWVECEEPWPGAKVTWQAFVD